MATARPEHQPQRNDARPLPENLRHSEYDADEASGVWFDPHGLRRDDRDDYADYGDDDYSCTDYGARRYAAWRRVASAAG